MPAKHIRIYFGKQKEFYLNFRLNKNEIAETWRNLLANEQPSGKSIKERTRFVGFEQNISEGIQSRIDKITFITDEIKKIRQDIGFGELDFSNVGEEVNRIHVHFADKYVLEPGLTKSEERLWCDLNITLHEVEILLGSYTHKKRYGISNSRFNVTFIRTKLDGLRKIPSAAFKGTSLLRSYGTIYPAYSRIGRHILEIYQSRDIKVLPEHVLPFREISADFTCWLGGTEQFVGTHNDIKKIKAWYEKNSHILENAGLFWDPQELGLGYIPLAYLDGNFESVEKKMEIQKKINEYKYIHSVELLD